MQEKEEKDKSTSILHHLMQFCAKISFIHVWVVTFRFSFYLLRWFKVCFCTGFQLCLDHVCQFTMCFSDISVVRKFSSTALMFKSGPAQFRSLFKLLWICALGYEAYDPPFHVFLLTVLKANVFDSADTTPHRTIRIKTLPYILHSILSPNNFRTPLKYQFFSENHPT